MAGRRFYITAVILFTVSGLSACGLAGRDITITDAKTVTGVNEDLTPVQILDSFPAGTAKISCWMKWRDAKINAEITTKWHYITDDIHIADQTLVIPKKDGMGSVELAMPEGKPLPPGSYKVDVVYGTRLLKALRFKVE
jgi:hypothetical protein